MTQDEIIEMATQAGAMFNHITWVERDLLPVFERFAKLVAEKEREACAEIAEKQRYAMYISLTSYPPQNGTAVGIANQIRAKGQA